MRTVYLTDGTDCGFFTAVFQAYNNESAYLTASPAFQTELGDTLVFVKTDEEKAKRVLRKLRDLDRRCLSELDYILRTPYSEKAQTAFLYLRQIVQKGAPVRDMLHLFEVRKAMDTVKRVLEERHRFTGFLRFHETEDGIYYAPFSPDHDIVDLLMPHFFSRFQKIPFIIHDTERNIAGISDGVDWLVTPAGEATVRFSSTESDFLKLWKKYYDSVYIPSRKNVRQMKNYMPVRYWKFMPERNG